jgi:hypothetical protein
MLSLIGGLLQLLLVVFVVLACGWVIRRLQIQPSVGWILRSAVVIVSVASGVGLCFVRYQPTPDLVMFGTPFPLAMFQRQRGAWLDFVADPLVMLVIGALNVLLVTAAFHGAVLAWLTLARRQRTTGTS